MLVSLATLALAAALSLASPAQVQRRDEPNSGLTWIYKDPILPKVMSVGPQSCCRHFSADTKQALQHRRWDYLVRFRPWAAGYHRLRRWPRSHS
jgi:hypothetical protein